MRVRKRAKERKGAMFYSGKDMIAVSGVGVAEARFDSVSYAATVKTFGKTGPKAREAATPIIKAVRDVIARLTKEVELDTDRLKTTISVDQQYKHDENGDPEFIGYMTTFTIAFTGTNVDAAIKVHDALTSIDGVEASSPVFNVENRKREEAIAFQCAVNDAQDSFDAQCEALGINAKRYRVNSWEKEEEHIHAGGKSMRMAAGGTLQPGKAEVRIKVRILFVPKFKPAA